MPSSAFQTRPITGDDLATIAEIFVACFSAPPWNEAWTVERAQLRLASLLQNPNCRGLVPTQGQKVIGMALGQIEPWVTDNLFQLQELCIAPSHQTQGIGRNLLQQLRAQVRAHDQVGSLYLLTNRASAAETFYAKLGFANSAQKLVMGMR